MNDQNALTKDDRIRDRIDRPTVNAMEIGGQGIQFTNAGEVLEFAKMMATSGSAIPRHLRGEPGACLGIIDDAIRFGFSPYALARKSYFVNDNLAYEAQVLAAIVNARAPLTERPLIEFSGEGPAMRCKVTFRFVGGADRHYESPAISTISPKNSPLWKTDPAQQLAYYSLRACARRHCSDILLGIYDLEEMQAVQAKDVTPPNAAITRISERLAKGRLAEAPGVAQDGQDAQPAVVQPDDALAAVEAISSAANGIAEDDPFTEEEKQLLGEVLMNVEAAENALQLAVLADDYRAQREHSRPEVQDRIDAIFEQARE